MVKYQDSSLMDKISFLCTATGFALVLFSFNSILNSYSKSPAVTPLLILSFLFYLVSTLTIFCYVTMDEVDDGKIIRIVHLGCSFFAGLFLLVGLGLYGDGAREYGLVPAYDITLGTCALLLAFMSLALGVFTFVVANRTTKTVEGGTEASAPTGPTTFTG